MAKPTKKTPTWLEMKEEAEAHFQAEGLSETEAAALAHEGMLYRMCLLDAVSMIELPGLGKHVDQTAVISLTIALRKAMALRERGAR